MDLDLFTKKLPFEKDIFNDTLMGKDTWGFLLGVSKRSLQRWEREIINNSVVKYSYHQDSEMVTALDGYKRFILLAIYQLKNGFIDNKRYTNKSAIEWIGKHKLDLIRFKFNKWMQQN